MLQLFWWRYRKAKEAPSFFNAIPVLRLPLAFVSLLFKWWWVMKSNYLGAKIKWRRWWVWVSLITFRSLHDCFLQMDSWSMSCIESCCGNGCRIGGKTLTKEEILFFHYYTPYSWSLWTAEMLTWGKNPHMEPTICDSLGSVCSDRFSAGRRHGLIAAYAAKFT